MKIEQATINTADEWQGGKSFGNSKSASMVLLFGDRELLSNQVLLKDITDTFPGAVQIGCSTAGEINGTNVTDSSLSITAIEFETASVKSASVNISDHSNSYEAGKHLASSISHDDLKHLFVVSDGLTVNGSDLVKGISNGLPDTIKATGGLAGDGGNFSETLVTHNGQSKSGMITVAGLYGDSIDVHHGSLGGWDPFGPKRLITRSEGNVLYEMDGKSALDLYKQYLGDHANDLPASGLLYPVFLQTSPDSKGIVRTILAVDEEQQSLTFAGDVPEGAYATLMKANNDRLIDGAIGAAEESNLQQTGGTSPDLAILISCVGRKMVLKQRVEEEIEGVSEVLGDSTRLTGFYSYGEISPFNKEVKCELHNQTMTITTISEK